MPLEQIKQSNHQGQSASSLLVPTASLAYTPLRITGEQISPGLHTSGNINMSKFHELLYRGGEMSPSEVQFAASQYPSWNNTSVKVSGHVLEHVS